LDRDDAEGNEWARKSETETTSGGLLVHESNAADYEEEDDEDDQGALITITQATDTTVNHELFAA
jgi:hypothetical protein